MDSCGEGYFGVRKAQKGIRFLIVRGSELGVLQTFMNNSDEFEHETKPSLAVKNMFWGVEGGGEDVTKTGKPVKGGPALRGVRDIVVSEGVSDDDLRNLGIVNQLIEKVGEGNGGVRNTGLRERGEVGRGILFHGWRGREKMTRKVDQTMRRGETGGEE